MDFDLSAAVRSIVGVYPTEKYDRFYGSLIRYVLFHNFYFYQHLADPNGIVLSKDHLKWFIDPQYTIDTVGAMSIAQKEPRTFKAFKSMRGALFVDVGANAGAYVLRGARQFQRVIALEPNPAVHVLLLKNITLNSIDNVQTLRVAACDRQGPLDLYEVDADQKSGTTSTLFPLVMRDSHGLKYGPATQVQGDTLDHMLEGVGDIDVIMVDAEGAEAEILTGARESLMRTRVLIVEVRPLTRSRVISLLPRDFHVTEVDERNGASNLLCER